MPGRSCWRCWYRWTTLAMLAHAFLVVAAMTDQARQPTPTRLIGLTCNEASTCFGALVAAPPLISATVCAGRCGDAGTSTAPAATNDKPPGHEQHDLRLEYWDCPALIRLASGLLGLRMIDPPVTLITGGASGIAAATARRLLDRGPSRGHHRARPRPTRPLAEELGEPAGLLPLAGDAADYTAVHAAVQATFHKFGRLDTVVANAGLATHDTLADGDPGRWREMVLTNVLGPALLIRAALPALQQTRGRIVLLGSVADFVHTPGQHPAAWSTRARSRTPARYA